MARKQPDPKSIYIEFPTSSLYRADGFESGDLLKKYFPHLSPAHLRDVLADVVIRDVVPQLDQTVSITVIPTARNPVRVTQVGNESVVWSTAEAGVGPKITPAVVAIDIERVRSRIPKNAAKPADELEVEGDVAE